MNSSQCCSYKIIAANHRSAIDMTQSNGMAVLPIADQQSDIINLSMASKDQEYKLETNQDSTDLLVSYLMGSTFHQYLRNTYPHFHLLTDDQKKLLVTNAQLFRIKEDHTTMLVNYNQCTLSIVIYGELKVRGKLLGKGLYFWTGVEKAEIHFMKKSVLMLINKEGLQRQMEEFELFYTKKEIIQRILPCEVLGFDKKSYKILCEYSQNIVNASQPPYNLLHQNEPGIFLFYEGTYALLTHHNLKIAELVLDSHGQECLWGGSPEYKVKPLTFIHKYLWLHKSVLLQVLNAEGLARLRENHERRQQVRRQIQSRCEMNRLNAKNYVQGQQQSSKKKYSSQQIQQFNQILERMSKRGYKAKWFKQEEAVRVETAEKTKKKKSYMPQKAKSRYFSTMENKPFDLQFYQTLHKIETTPYHLKLHLHQRASTQLLFHRRAKTQTNFRQHPIESQERELRKTSHSYYSYNYDRSYTTGMSNLAKMKQYEKMKESSTLKRGEKILSTEQLAQALKTSFGQLNSTIACSKRQRNMNPMEFLERSQKKNKLLVRKLMDSKGATTWR